MKKTKNLDLIIILIVIATIGFVTAILLAIKPGQIKSVDKITHVDTRNYRSMDNNARQYFVFVYNSNDQSESATFVKNCVISYANKARQNKDLPKIYVIDYQDDKTIINGSNFNLGETSLPCLATITTSGTISNKKDRAADICNLLEDYISGKEHID